MHYLRIYAGPNGESHVEDVDVELPQRAIVQGVPAAGLSESYPASSFNFFTSPPGWSDDFHPSPQPVAIIVTAGEHEFETSDGETRIVGPGSIVLFEDTTGKGHRARDVGQLEAQAVVVWMPD